MSVTLDKTPKAQATQENINLTLSELKVFVIQRTLPRMQDDTPQDGRRYLRITCLIRH